MATLGLILHGTGRCPATDIGICAVEYAEDRSQRVNGRQVTEFSVIVVVFGMKVSHA